MQLNTELLKTDGFTDDEIRQVREYCDAAEAAGGFSRLAAVVQLNGKTRFVCRTLAEILDRLRPDSWLDGPVGDEPLTPKDRASSRRAKRRKAKQKRPVRGRSHPGSRIKVHWTYREQDGGPSGEFLWARRIGKDTAKIENIPFFAGGLALGDLVRIDDDNEIVEVLEHVARTCGIQYGDPDRLTREEAVQRYAEIKTKLAEHDIHTEGIIPGLCSLSVPNDVDPDMLADIADELGVEVCEYEALDE